MSLNSGSCWEILELESTDNKKLIKRAYHKLLRQYKPDEHPDEFKILYEAYQNALSGYYHEWQDDDYEEDEDEFETKNDNDEIENNLYQEELEEEISENFYDDYWQRLETFEKKVDYLTYDNNYPELFNKLDSWNFLKELDVTSDLDFFQEASTYLFSATSAFDEKHKTALLDAEVIQYFNQIFLWTKHWENLDQESTVFEYLEVRVDPLFTLEKNATKRKPATMLERLQAFAIDLVIPIFLTFLVSPENIHDTIQLIGGYYILIQASFFTLLGLKSLGQFIMKLEVLEGVEQEKTTFTARWIRLFFTFISMISIVFVVQDPIANQVFFIPIGFNIIFWLSQKRLLQDYSATRIIKL